MIEENQIYFIDEKLLEKAKPITITYSYENLRFDFQWTGSNFILSLTKDNEKYPIKEMYLHLSDINQGILEVSDKYRDYHYIGAISREKISLTILTSKTILFENSKTFELLQIKSSLKPKIQATLDNLV